MVEESVVMQKQGYISSERRTDRDRRRLQWLTPTLLTCCVVQCREVLASLMLKGRDGEGEGKKERKRKLAANELGAESRQPGSSKIFER